MTEAGVRRLRWEILSIAAAAVLLLAGCTDGDVTKAGGGETPITLTLGLPERGDAIPYLPDVRLFAQEVESRSGGGVRVEYELPPLEWRADVELDLARDVSTGRIDLALVPARAFGALGLDGLLALETPGLIRSAAAGVAIERDPLAQRMLATIGDGRLGLALLFESIRRPAGYGSPLATPADFAGTNIRVSVSPVAAEGVRALGARPVVADQYAVSPAGETLAGADTAFAWANSLPKDAVITANLVLSAKFNVLVASQSTWDRLSASQRSALTDAAAAVTARDRSSAETDAALVFCRSGHEAVLADPADVEAVEGLLAPVVADLASDPAVRRDIETIRSIVKDVADPPVELPPACGPPTGDAAPWPRAP